MVATHLLLAFCWILFCALHSAFASLWWKQRVQRWMGGNFRYYRLWYTLFAFVSLGAVVWYQVSMRSPFVFVPNTAASVTGVAVMAAGVVVMGICIRKYFMHLSGLKSLYLNDEQAANQLQVTGIHRFVRHPLYSGTFLAIWGLWLLVPQASLLVANSVITIYTIMAIGWEEQKLVAEFGDDYRRYKKQVPRLLPLPWRTAPKGI